MRNLREILRNSVIGKFLVHVFILNFFTCQCLAMTPQEIIVENFRNNTDALFKEFDHSQEKLSLSLNRSESAKFELKITKTDSYAQKEEKSFISDIKTSSDGTEFIQFRFTEGIDPIVFYLCDGVCDLSYLDGRISILDSLRNEKMPIARL